MEDGVSGIWINLKNDSEGFTVIEVENQMVVFAGTDGFSLQLSLRLNGRMG